MCLAQCLVKRPILLNVSSRFDGGGASGMLWICGSRAYKAGCYGGWRMMTYGPDYVPPQRTGAAFKQATLRQGHMLAGDGGLLTVAKASRDRQGMHNKQQYC